VNIKEDEKQKVSLVKNQRRIDPTLKHSDWYRRSEGKASMQFVQPDPDRNPTTKQGK
jgi:hypothetical protein